MVSTWKGMLIFVQGMSQDPFKTWGKNINAESQDFSMKNAA